MPEETPARSIRFVHEALRQEANAIEDLAFASPPDIDALAEKTAFMQRMNRIHTDGEEAFLFPIVERLAPRVADTYLRDHHTEQAIFTELTDLITAARTDPDSVMSRLRRQAIALAEHFHDHLGKENELIVPLLEQNLSIPEQAAMVEAVVSHIPPTESMVMIPWIVRAQTPDDGAIFIQEILGNMPPAVQPLAKSWIKEGVSPELWTALTARVPALAE